MTEYANFYVESENVQLKTSGIEFLYTYHERDGCTVYPHIHESIELLYILDGEFLIYADQSKYSVKNGDLIMFRSNSLHRIYSISNRRSHYFVMKIKPSVLLSLADSNNGYAYVMRFVLHNDDKIYWEQKELENTPIPAYVQALMREHDNPGTGTDVMRKATFAALLISLLRDDEAHGRTSIITGAGISAIHQIYKAVNYMNKNYSNDISVLDCAKEVNMSYSYFSRTFQKITGKQFRRYLNEIRVNHAEKLMMQTDRSITEIAMECGFNDVSYFISQYKSLRGMTPNKFRKST